MLGPFKINYQSIWALSKSTINLSGAFQNQLSIYLGPFKINDLSIYLGPFKINDLSIYLGPFVRVFVINGTLDVDHRIVNVRKSSL